MSEEKYVDASALLKERFPLNPTAEQKEAARKRHEEWQAREKKNREALQRAIDVGIKALADHHDNTGIGCRKSLDGHDCCSICTAAEEIAQCVLAYEAQWDTTVGD